MAEVQQHGNLFEDQVIKSVTGLGKDEYQKLLKNAYTASMDIKQGIHSDHDYSIKVSKNGVGVGCGDILRFNKHCTAGFKMVVGAWRQSSEKVKTYYEIYEFDITPDDYKKLWAGIDSSVLTPFVDYIKSIPEGPEGQAVNKKLWKERRKAIYDTHGKGLVRIDAKVDSKNQRRVQCSVRTKELIENGVAYQRFTNEYKGITLPFTQDSESRKFT